MVGVCFECGNRITTTALEEDYICLRCYLDAPLKGEAYRRSDDPTSAMMSIDAGDEYEAQIDEYWVDRNIDSVDGAISNLAEYLDEIATPALLGKLILHTGISRQLFLDQGNDGGIGPQLVEYLLGVAACQSPTGVQGGYYELLRKTSAVTDRIQVANKTEPDLGKASVAYELGIREISLGHIASPGQYVEAARRFYEPHAHWMESQFGFSIGDAIEIATAIRDEKDSRDSNLYTKISDIAARVALFDRIVLFRSVIPDIAAEYADKIDTLDSWGRELATDLYWVPRSRIKQRTDLSDTRARAVLDFLTVRLGEAEGFQDPADHNPLHETPLLEFEGNVLLPPKGVVEYAISTTFKYQLRTDEYEDRFNDAMGDVVEAWTADVLTTHLDDPTIVTNVEYTYNGDEYEADVVLRAGDAVAVFECKSKGLTLPTRKGHRGGLSEIEDDVEKGLGKAYSQAHRLIEAIESGAVTELVGQAATVDVAHCTEFQPCAIVPEAYDGLITVGYPEFIDMKTYPLYAASLFDIEPVAATLSSPDRFVEYLNWRAEIVNTHDIYTPDEDDLLQAFLDDIDWIHGSEQTAMIAGRNKRYKNSIYEYDSEYTYE